MASKLPQAGIRLMPEDQSRLDRLREFAARKLPGVALGASELFRMGLAALEREWLQEPAEPPTPPTEPKKPRGRPKGDGE